MTGTEFKKNKTAKSRNDIVLHAATGINQGEIELLWEPHPDAKAYVIQITSSLNSEKYWKHFDIVIKARYTASGLKSMKTYRFRIAYVTLKEQSIWSSPVSKQTR